MKKLILTVACFVLLGMSVPAFAMNMVFEMGVAEQTDELQPVIGMEGNVATIQWASGMTLEVVSLTGRAIATYKIESTSQRIELNLPKGCYILKVGKVVRKVTVR
jgi:hypothetical protein